MPEIPQFAEAVIRFEAFLRSEGIPTPIIWAFRDDVWRRSQERVLVRWPVSDGSDALVEKVFAEGRTKGLVEIVAIARGADWTLATVWYPKYEHEEVQGWSEQMKLSISQPLPRATPVGPLLWRLMRYLPGFRRYQASEIWIGSRKWASA
jgi:hypothetical protein